MFFPILRRINNNERSADMTRLWQCSDGIPCTWQRAAFCVAPTAHCSALHITWQLLRRASGESWDSPFARSEDVVREWGAVEWTVEATQNAFAKCVCVLNVLSTRRRPASLMSVLILHPSCIHKCFVSKLLPVDARHTQCPYLLMLRSHAGGTPSLLSLIHI